MDEKRESVRNRGEARSVSVIAETIREVDEGAKEGNEGRTCLANLPCLKELLDLQTRGGSVRRAVPLSGRKAHHPADLCPYVRQRFHLAQRPNPAGIRCSQSQPVFSHIRH